MDPNAVIAIKQAQQERKVEQRNNRKSWWRNLSPEQRRLINNIAIGLGISVVAAIGIHFGVRFIRSKVAISEENKSFGKDKHATWAKQIKNAFDNNGWWGTNEVMLRTALLEIPSKEDFEKVRKSYRHLYKGENLVQTMTSELKDSEYDEMLAIISSKPKRARDAQAGAVILDPLGWAKRFYAAMSYEWLGFGWGTDEDAILAVVNEIPTRKAFSQTAMAYHQKYGNHLLIDLQGDLSASDYSSIARKILAKPEQ